MENVRIDHFFHYYSWSFLIRLRSRDRSREITERGFRYGVECRIDPNMSIIRSIHSGDLPSKKIF